MTDRRKVLSRERHLVPRAAMTAVVLALSLVAAACSTNTASGGPSSSKTTGTAAAGSVDSITVPLSASISTLDPLIDVAASTAIISQMMQALVWTGVVNGKPEIKPWLAKSWTTSDNVTWKFSLDPAAKWQDGTPVTADDVLFTIKTEMAPNSPHAASFVNLASVSEIDPHTVQFVLKKPNAAWTVDLGIVYIVPKAYYQKVGHTGFSAHPIGSGPYEFVKSEGGGAELATWPDYPHAKPAIKRLVFKPVTSPQAQLAALESGSVDVVQDVPFSQVDRLKAVSGIQVATAPSTNSVFIGFNTTSAPLDNVAFRSAVNLAINRDAIVKTLLNGYGTPLGSPVPKGAVGYDDSIAPTPVDTAKAKQELSNSGYSGQTITFTYPTSSMPIPDQLASAIASDLGQVGIKVKLVPLDYATFLQQWVGKKIPGMYLFQYRNGIDAEFIVTSLYTSDSRAYFSDSKADDLVDAERSAVGDAARAQALHNLWDYTITQQHYYAMVLAPDVIYGVRAGVPFTPSPTDVLTFIPVPEQ